jgi:serine/threonine protein kinase
MIELPGYTIEKQLGRGGMARVYLARHNGLDRLVAIKVLSRDLIGDKSFSERFMREARIVASLTQQNIITVYDVGVHNEHHYIAMEYLPGETLDDKIKKKLNIKQILSFTQQIATALDYAHKKGIVHRDVKPDNILFREDGTAVLTDFGIARSTTSETKMTTTGTVIGTPHYMSPEQAQGQEIGPWSDLYSLGIVLFEMMSGEVPFDADSTIAVVFKHITEPVPDLAEPYKQYQSLVNTLLAKEPAARYQTGREVIADIECLERGEAPANASLIFKQAALSQTTLNPAANITPIQTAQNNESTTEDKTPSAKRKLLTAIAATGFITIAAAVALFSTQQDSKKAYDTAANQQALNLAYKKQQLEKRQTELDKIAAENVLLEQQRIEKEKQQLKISQQQALKRQQAERIAREKQAKAEAEARQAKRELQALKQKQLVSQRANQQPIKTLAAAKTRTATPEKTETSPQETEKTGLFAGWLGDVDDNSKEYINDLFTAADNALATQHYVSAQENYKKILQINPDNPRALKSLQQAQQQLSSNQSDNNDAYIQDLIKAADNALETNRLSSASHNFQKVLGLSPGNKHAENGLNEVFHKHLQFALEEAKDNDFDDAAEHFIAAKQLKPGHEKLESVGQKIADLRKN